MRLLWIIFSSCLLIVFAAMAWISATALRLERERADTARQAIVEENIRLALWRMDSIAAPVIAQETARPYFEYTAFTPAERAYTKLFSELKYGEVLIPSPPLVARPPFVQLHFQFAPDGSLSSPQVPTGNMRDIAVGRKLVNRDQIEGAHTLLQQAESIVHKKELMFACEPPPAQDIFTLTLQNSMQNSGQNSPATLPASVGRQVTGNYNVGFQNMEIKDVQQANSAPIQKARGQLEYTARSQSLNNDNTYQQLSNRSVIPPATGREQVRHAVMKPLWSGGQLLLARRVAVDGREYVQCCWLDWPAMRTALLESIKDILPSADLLPAESADEERQPRMLASIPARLIPGNATLPAGPLRSPVRITLAIAWTAVLLGSAAVAALLAGVMRLSERRASFVSAVTHELRTPLTTVSMYAEMLEGDMIEAPQRKEYLHTLRAESQRLGHLVENVLAYARLEKGSASTRLKEVSVAELLSEATPRAAQRLQQAGMELSCPLPTADCPLDSLLVRADPSAVEQILFNLADNAAKYAHNDGSNQVAISIAADNKRVQIRFADTGPGISTAQSARLFQPFSKSAVDAAHSAPGVGLGLALCRRLARQMGGDLCHERTNEKGAMFVLTLPRA